MTRQKEKGTFANKVMGTPLLKALFCEDQEWDAELVQKELRELAVVTRAGTRAELVAALKQPWDVVLLDLFIPGMTGDEAMRIIKEADPNVPVIVVTGSVDDEGAATACQAGAVDFLRKDRLRRLRQAVTSAIENTKRKQREMRNQRLELLGELVVGLSHDLRNVLSVILAGVEIIRPKLQPAELRIVDVINGSVRRAEEMLVQLLAFGRGETGEPHKVSAEYVVGEIDTLLRSTFPKNITVEVKTALGTAEIRCDESQLNRALWNLCVNARDAMMPAGGQLLVSAQNVELPGGKFVCIAVKDSGHGIPESVRERIFEPFFTTKGSKGGTGLGLAMTQHIIAAHGGKIEVASSSAGTEFSVYLPIADKNHITVPEFDGHGKTVLLVEDEEFLRAWAKLRLEKANYRVLDAGNGGAAMNLFIQNLETVDVLVTDINMPTMQGNQLAAALRELKPDLKLIYVSGLDQTRDYQPVPSAILGKPFPSVKLLEKLEEVLA